MQVRKCSLLIPGAALLHGHPSMEPGQLGGGGHSMLLAGCGLVEPVVGCLSGAWLGSETLQIWRFLVVTRLISIYWGI